MRKRKYADSELRRPRGITAYCLFQVLFVVYWILVAVGGSDRISRVQSAPLFLALGGFILVSLALAGFSTIGMWTGERWGWGLGAYTAVRYFGLTITLLTLYFSHIVSLSEATKQSIVGSCIWELPLWLVILWYMFRPRVWNFFGLDLGGRLMATAILFLIACGELITIATMVILGVMLARLG